jgi:hypothetical protein
VPPAPVTGVKDGVIWFRVSVLEAMAWVAVTAA